MSIKRYEHSSGALRLHREGTLVSFADHEAELAALHERTDRAEAELAEEQGECADLRELVILQGEKLRAVVNALRGPPPPDTAWSVHDAPELAVATVAELAEARRDAERYRWLRDDCSGKHWSVYEDDGTGGSRLMGGPDLDAAIDAARKEGP